MFKKSFAVVLILISSNLFLSGERLGNVSLHEGMPLPFSKGVSWEYDGGFIQVFIHDDTFTLVFLDYDKKLRVVDTIDLALVHAQSVPGQGDFSPYHLYPSPGGLYYSNPRHVYLPRKYNVKVALRKEISNIPRYRTHRFDTRYVKDSFDVKLLDQRED